MFSLISWIAEGGERAGGVEPEKVHGKAKELEPEGQKG